MQHVQVRKPSLILGKWMRSEILGSSGERPTVNEAVGRFSVFLASRISHSICASQVSGYVLRPVACDVGAYHMLPSVATVARDRATKIT
jgi:hypothetical protein